MSLKPATIVAVALLVALLGPPALPALAQHPCDAPNILFNCNFDTFASVGNNKQVPEGWWYFLETGDPALDQSPDTAFGAPSLRIWSDGGSFAGGIYQVVPNVTPGARYQANIGWAAASVANLGRQLGIDPTGGTDSRSANVVWGPMCWDKTRMPKLTVSAVAAGATITVFVRVQHDMSYGADQVFLDAVSLMLDRGAAGRAGPGAHGDARASDRDAATGQRHADPSQRRAVGDSDGHADLHGHVESQPHGDGHGHADRHAKPYRQHDGDSFEDADRHAHAAPHPDGDRHALSGHWAGYMGRHVPWSRDVRVRGGCGDKWAAVVDESFTRPA